MADDRVQANQSVKIPFLTTVHVLTVIIILFVFCQLASANPGQLDECFGGGLVTRCDGLGLSVATQADGKILVAGRADNGDEDLMVARYLPSGMRDTSFGVLGIATWDGGNDEWAEGIVVQPDGRIIVVGSMDNGVELDIVVLRFHPDGSLDGSFGIGGVVKISSVNSEWGNAVALQPNGRIVVIGKFYNGSSNDMLVVRLDSDGELDSSFNGVGVLLWDNGGKNDNCNGLVLQPDGRIVVVGESGGLGNSDVAVVRFLEDGTIDSGFAINGVFLWDGLGEERGNEVALQPDGRIVVIGSTKTGGNVDLLVLRLTGGGDLDDSFDGDGVATWDGGGEDHGIDILVQDGGLIVVCGQTYNGSNSDALLLGFDSDGNLDGDFADGGSLIWDGGHSDILHALISQPDGKILVAGGTSCALGKWNTLLMRLNRPSALPVPTLYNFGLFLLIMLIALLGLILKEKHGNPKSYI